MLKRRRSYDRLIFNMEIPIPGKDGLFIETGPDGEKFGTELEPVPAVLNQALCQLTVQSLPPNIGEVCGPLWLGTWAYSPVRAESIPSLQASAQSQVCRICKVVS